MADQGFAPAQVNLGAMFMDGIGVEQDYAEALRLFRLAAAQERAEAQAYLGRIFENGLGVARDIVEAVRWYRLAAQQGVRNATTALFRLGVGV